MLPHDVEDFEAQVVGVVRNPLDAWAVFAVESGFRGRWASCVEVARSRRPRATRSRSGGTSWASAKLSLWGSGPYRSLEEWVVGFHAEDAQVWGQASWWVGRASGQWAQARHLQLRGKTTSRTNVPHTWSWGGTVMDGQGVVGAYALVPRLEGRMWSPLPKSGTRMGIWVSRGAGRMRWTVHATWAPSQQETFRCAWRCRWEA